MVRVNKEEARTVMGYLRNSPLFTHLDEPSLLAFLQGGRLIHCEKATRVIQEGTVQSDFYLVARGSVDVTVQEGDKEVFISTIGEGHFFGEAGLFARVRRTANVVASEGTVLVALGRESFLEFLRKSPKTGIQLLLLMIYSLLKKLRSVNQELAFERKFDIDQEDIDDIIRGILDEKEG